MIPLARPDIDDEDISGVVQVLKSGMLSLGPKLTEFENKFAQFIGTKYAIAVNSGTSGLHLVVKALGLKSGDEVITSPFSFIASSNCLLYEGVKPVFVDIDPKTFNIDASQIEGKITSKTKAILPVHVFGQTADMGKIMTIAKKHNLFIIEDACEAIAATHRGKKAGTFGNAAVFAFYPNKQMTTGEGGIIVTNDEQIYKLCKSMANQGRGDSMQWLTHDRLGYNYRMSDLQASLGITQLNKIERMIARREIISKRYMEELSNVEGLKVPHIDLGNRHTWFVFPLQVEKGIDRNKVIDELHKRGVASKAYFYPCIHLQPFYAKERGYEKGDYPVSEAASESIFIIPLYPSMTDGEVSSVIKAVKDSVGAFKDGT